MKSASIMLATAILVALSNLAAVAQNPARPRIFIADADGNNVKLLVEIPEAGYHGSPHWSADGKLILMNAMPRDRGYEQARIYACAIGGPFNGNVAEIGLGSCARFSPDMTRIACHVRAGNPDQLQPGIWVMRDDGSDRKHLGDGTRPRWTSDGKSLVFVPPAGNTLHIINADGTGERPLLNTTYASVAGASLSPDGKHVCYIAYPQQAYDGVLYRVPLVDPAAAQNQIEPQAVHRGRIGWDPAWSPDGRKILFWRIEEDSSRRLVVMDAEGRGEPTELLNQQGAHYTTDAEWSPDSRRIVFASDRQLEQK